ncbi:hypothetical protein QAD02_018235 [Eretmocerus hayati]|uniref:Uncharacterized protein n=1 Tax=Eretmocerus hayati TaxID=131215 RepID=A0ACC2PH84_9HYME|nr:hypothetical protein QAD02_018235 [Eretmocerus hayati]
MDVVSNFRNIGRNSNYFEIRRIAMRMHPSRPNTILPILLIILSIFHGLSASSIWPWIVNRGKLCDTPPLCAVIASTLSPHPATVSYRCDNCVSRKIGGSVESNNSIIFPADQIDMETVKNCRDCGFPALLRAYPDDGSESEHKAVFEGYHRNSDGKMMIELTLDKVDNSEAEENAQRLWDSFRDSWL